MLEAIRSRAQGIFAWIIVGLIAIPFTLWGVNNYFRGGGQALAATVNGEDITLREFRSAFQRYTQQMRLLMGAGFSQEMLDDPALKKNVLAGLIEQRLLLQTAMDLELQISDVELSQVIRQNKAFQNESGQFDSQRYEVVLRSQGLTSVAFEDRLRLALLREQLISALRLSAFVTQQELKDIARLRYQEREIGYGIVPLSKYRDTIQISEEESRHYYKEHQTEFRTPERIVVNYLRLSAEALAQDIPVDEKILRDFYDETKDQYTVSEQRRASHILIKIPPGGDEAAQRAARKKAEAVLKRLQQGESFEKVAKEVSQDPGSARQGGDLGFFGRGVMDPAFEKAVFSLKAVGDLSGLVLSQFGYHIIELTAIRPAKVKPFEEVRGEMKEKYRQRRAQEQFYERVEKLENLTYENPFTLEVAAEVLNLPIKTSAPFSQKGGEGIAANPKVVTAAFSKEVLQEGMNSLALELGLNDLVVLRINKHIPADIQPFEEVRERIREKLTLEQAKTKAQGQGEALIKRLQKGGLPEAVFATEEITWNEKAFYTRRSNDSITAEILAVAYQLPHPQSGHPVFSGQSLKSGDYVVVGLYAVRAKDLSQLDEKVRQSLTQRIKGIHSEMAYWGFIGQLKSAADIKIYSENL